MLRILDRYVLRELLTPFLLALLVLTFALEIPPILQHGEALIAEGASWDVVVRVLATLVPQALGITIPMALLVGILISLGRLSGDRESYHVGVRWPVAFCGRSCVRRARDRCDLRQIVASRRNQAFREITFRLLMSRSESDQAAGVLRRVSQS
jgi:hypothetical protein